MTLSQPPRPVSLAHSEPVRRDGAEHHSRLMLSLPSRACYEADACRAVNSSVGDARDSGGTALPVQASADHRCRARQPEKENTPRPEARGVLCFVWVRVSYSLARADSLWLLSLRRRDDDVLQRDRHAQERIALPVAEARVVAAWRSGRQVVVVRVQVIHGRTIAVDRVVDVV